MEKYTYLKLHAVLTGFCDFLCCFFYVPKWFRIKCKHCFHSIFIRLHFMPTTTTFSVCSVGKILFCSEVSCMKNYEIKNSWCLKYLLLLWTYWKYKIKFHQFNKFAEYRKNPTSKQISVNWRTSHVKTLSVTQTFICIHV